MVSTLTFSKTFTLSTILTSASERARSASVSTVIDVTGEQFQNIMSSQLYDAYDISVQVEAKNPKRKSTKEHDAKPDPILWWKKKHKSKKEVEVNTKTAKIDRTPCTVCKIQYFESTVDRNLCSKCNNWSCGNCNEKSKNGKKSTYICIGCSSFWEHFIFLIWWHYVFLLCNQFGSIWYK